MAKVLDRIERLGNALPDPVVIFLWLIAALIAASVLAAALGASAVHPLTGAPVVAERLLSEANVRRLLAEMPLTFVHFPPLGLVVVVMLGAAVAERSGLLAVLVGRAVRAAPRTWLTPATFLVALLSHHASDASYVVSHDNGDTWSDALSIIQIEGDCMVDDKTTEGAVPVVGVEGNYYVVWSHDGIIFLDKSTDRGKTWMTEDKVIVSQPGGWSLDIPGIDRCNGMPVIKSDHSRSKYRGNTLCVVGRSAFRSQ